MTIFNFLFNIIQYSGKSFGNFTVTFLIMLLMIVGIVAIINSFSKIKLFNSEILKKSQKNKENSKEDNKIKRELQQVNKNPLKKESNINVSNKPSTGEIYDLLVDAYDRYKSRQKNKDDSNKNNI